MEYIIGILITVAIVTPLCIKWANLLENQKDRCEECDPETCPFPPCYDCPKHSTKMEDGEE